MEALEIARWQFGITTVYHFMMVPLTIGLGLVVAVMQTLWHRTGKEEYLRMTKFWGKLFLINFIMGVATGIVQEFQFGMAWSEYSRFVGDVFGAPLALESLLAFFVESTFLGLWIFGWKQLKPAIHLACLWVAVVGSVFSAYFIIVANSWMQHPVGAKIIDGRPVMTDAWAVFTNNTALVAFPHTLMGALAVAGGFLLGIAWYHLWRRRTDGIDTVGADGKVIPGEAAIPGRDRTDYKVWIRSLRIGAVVAMISFAGTALTGDLQGKLMFEQQPMKMAAAEAACHDGTGFSVLSIGNLGSMNCDDIKAVIEVPGILSFLAKGDFTTEVKGVNSLLDQYKADYGTHLPNNPIYGERAGQEIQYVPVMEVTYWGFRMMIGFGGIAALAALLALWVTRTGTVPASRWLMRLAVFGILAPFGANAAGWIFTEMGRQPFVVAPNPDLNGIDQVFMFTAAAVSPGVSAGELLTSLIVLTAVYAALLVVEVKLLVKFIRGGVVSAMPELAHTPADENGDANKGPGTGKPAGDVLAFAY
ncbi:cytochrome ubiquinol oxidase subunit I [Pseudarthrobacter sp. NBSH8]|uniref:cytochrome ubiquinol oxidase subunit I n=1 Tax=Pseudarthrobacter sp. NBSH8 TaxID=2596911 RepID=UPI00162924B9|nr:cytochrome ubiquinol oxidase subunit I [Pseudarthrobacter sp. NBSH8]QNE14295.1 cytochrome ubiquinol oxidase subunit I [Pseudarthrobacter sp. NBSH8]